MDPKVSPVDAESHDGWRGRDEQVKGIHDENHPYLS